MTKPKLIMGQPITDSDPLAVTGTFAENYSGTTTVATGALVGVTSATQLPAISCKLARFMAPASNAGNVYLGVAGVTKISTSTDATSGFRLEPGGDTGWIPLSNLNLLYRICDNAAPGDMLSYMVLN